MNNEEDLRLQPKNNSKVCDLCGRQYIPKKNQKYCETCQKHFVPMYRDLKRNREPIYDYGDIKNPLLSSFEQQNDISFELFFINQALTLDYNAIIHYRATKAAAYFEALRKGVVKDCLNGLTSEIVQKISLNYLRIINDAIIMVDLRLSKSIFADFIGPIYHKSCIICGEPLITLKPLTEKSRGLFKECLDDWAVKQVLPEEELNKIKKALVINKKPQTKYHPQCKKYKNTDYQREYKRKRRKKERELRQESKNKAYKEHGSLMNQYNTGKGTIPVSAERKETNEAERDDINRIFKELGLRPTFKK
ncbi:MULTISPECIES: hypothetical protein [Methanobacterium]|uniref:Uncharacterized protein n=1 Tax=Methanobacterium bryantii TaxID=2161 RepID=A0A2A2H410_METBR|nr:MULTISPECIES: hypothetical protein [Methanobacterium]OEC86745.1 hypothetical protein A9507_09865 [Methanobacterium sp. A39]PAV04023.1 hypothetical protein ASJ80_03140 [Methanobacterium bryantii]